MVIYHVSERARYEPPACPSCGRRVHQEWLNVSTYGQPDMYTPGHWVCRTDGCPYNPYTEPAR